MHRTHAHFLEHLALALTRLHVIVQSSYTKIARQERFTPKQEG